ncbi:hypothetical protein BJX63DRAFT_441780 [Aspergillus granulosus]|uniref:Uncharacterized protein n=1 Tax=Aspergillus granulosus TaxID=176169 RepID=A0ABR4GRY6_9EURO
MGASHTTKISFQPSSDIPSLRNKVILITGGNSGLGKQSLSELCQHEPNTIWLASRRIDTANKVVGEMKDQGYNYKLIKPIELDLSSLASIMKAALAIRAQTPRLDILMLNAGIMAVPPGVTKDGYEIQFGTNYLGHAFLVHCLLPLLVETAQLPGSDVRVVLLSSVAHHYAPRNGIIFSDLKTSSRKIGTVARYGQSKLAIILYGQELAKRYPMLKVAIVHPGQVKTNLGNTASSSSFIMHILWKLTTVVIGVDPEIGVLNQLWAATADIVQSGEYYEPIGVIDKGSKHTRQSELAVNLWNWTMQEFTTYEDS